MKKLILLAALLLTLSGCSGGLGMTSNFSETERLKLIRTVAVDKTALGVTVTAATASGIGDEGEAIFAAEGATLAEAVGALEKNSMKYDANFTHTDFIVVGESAAADGIAELLDYVARAMQMRLGTKLFVASGSAQELVTSASGGNTSASDMLASLVKDVPFASGAAVTSCGDAVRSLAEDGCALVRMVKSEKSGEVSPDGEYTAIVPDGFAVIGDGKLVSHLPQEDDAAIGLLTGTMKSGYDTVSVDGARMTLQLDSYRVTALPAFGDDGLAFHIRAELNENVVETSLPADAELSAVQAAAERELSEKMRTQIEKAIRDSQKTGDYLHLWRMLERKAPLKTAKLTDRAGAYRNAPFTVEVTARIGRTGDLSSPLGTGGGDAP